MKKFLFLFLFFLSIFKISTVFAEGETTGIPSEPTEVPNGDPADINEPADEDPDDTDESDTESSS